MSHLSSVRNSTTTLKLHFKKIKTSLQHYSCCCCSHTILKPLFSYFISSLKSLSCILSIVYFQLHLYCAAFSIHLTIYFHHCNIFALVAGTCGDRQVRQGRKGGQVRLKPGPLQQGLLVSLAGTFAPFTRISNVMLWV